MARAECGREALKAALIGADSAGSGSASRAGLRRLPILHFFGVSWANHLQRVFAHHAIPLSPKLPQRLAVVAALRRSAPVGPALAASNDVVDVLIDQATLVRLDRPAAEIVVGNPSIADVSVQSGKVLVVTGKSFGETNLIVMDADGKVFVSRRLIVQEPRAGFVTVYRGRRQADAALRAVLHATAGHRR